MNKIKDWVAVTSKNDINQTLGFHSWVLEDKKALFLAPPKVACTRIKLTLNLLQGNAGPTNTGEVHSKGARLADFPKDKIYEILNSKEWLRFTFVRNPYSRLVSAYNTQIGNTWNDAYRWLVDDIKEKYHLPEDQKYIVPFPIFVRYLKNVNEKVRRDGHFNLQSRILAMGVIKYYQVGRFESFKEDFTQMLNMLDAPKRITNTVTKVKNKSNNTQLSLIYNKELAESVYILYKNDFQFFDYAEDSWMFEVN
jgi:hypothetical protein